MLRGFQSVRSLGSCYLHLVSSTTSMANSSRKRQTKKAVQALNTRKRKDVVQQSQTYPLNPIRGYLRAPSGAKDERGMSTPAHSKRSKTEPALETSRYLLKSDATSCIENGVDLKFDIDDLMNSPSSTAPWDGVRNAQARNFIKQMRIGDQAFFYHSNCKKPCIVGICEVVKEAYPDSSAWDPAHPHNYDPKSDPDSPKWFMVDVRFIRKLSTPVFLEELKKEAHSAALGSIVLLKRPRLSVQPVTAQEWDYILSMEQQASS